MIYSEVESLPRSSINALQLDLLQSLLKRVYETVPFYKGSFDGHGVDPSKFSDLRELEAYPFTYKSDMRDNYPFGLFSVPIDKVVRLHASSGTTGKPTVVGYSSDDIELWTELMARSLYGAGISRGDILQNSYGYGLFTGGLGAHYGAERLGASVIPMSGGNSARQLMIMKDFGTTAICCTPSYALNLADVASDEGIDLTKLPVKIGVFGAEPWTDEMRAQIEDSWGIDAVDIYGLSELIGPGVACECLEAKDGLHISEDHFLVETIDPITEKVLPVGEVGELVFTTISKEVNPLIRYRTRDIARVNPEPCRCGRTFYRMSKVSGRSDDMLIIRGVNLFPSQIEAVLVTQEGVLPHYQLIVTRENRLDELEVLVEVEETLFSDKIGGLQKVMKNIQNDIKSSIGISANIRLVEPKTLARSEGKAQRVIDKR